VETETLDGEVNRLCEAPSSALQPSAKTVTLEGDLDGIRGVIKYCSVCGIRDSKSHIKHPSLPQRVRCSLPSRTPVQLLGPDPNLLSVRFAASMELRRRRSSSPRAR
jgi:hypothetical protein